MTILTGAYNTAVCYTDTLEPTARSQIAALCDREEFSTSKIRIMPDVHAGMGCTIGTTMTIHDKIVPGMVGVDIGCGMETVRLEDTRINFDKLDSLIRSEIPSGRSVRSKAHSFADEIDLTSLRCADSVNLARAVLSIGTLGGGNHFIEVDCDAEGKLYLVVHSGSRHLGREVAEYYQNEGLRAMWGGAKHQVQALVESLKAQGRFNEINGAIKQLKKEHPINIPKDLAWVEGQLFDDYLHDMKIIQHFADLNRKAMMKTLLRGMNLTEVARFTTVHNYIDIDSMILRKGAVSAKDGETLLIPINMRDGSLICIGKGNADWNCSAPHGAGRLLSRAVARQTLSMQEYRAQMEGIYSTCIDRETLDESPMAYKSMAEIVVQITPTANIVSHIKPIYNFKAAE